MFKHPHSLQPAVPTGTCCQWSVLSPLKQHMIGLRTMQRNTREALTLAPMSILLKQKVLRWELDSFTAGSIVSWKSFSTNWQM